LNHWVSPNDQFHIVGEFDDVSLNCTARGNVPEGGVPVKVATGAITGAVTVTYPLWETMFVPALLLTVRFTVNVPAVV
jgi:hypothetical protein